jgi:AraC-like DNA-binding protein
VLPTGLETIGLLFDPAWLKETGFAFDRPRIWLGGPAALEARKLIQHWNRPHASEGDLRAATTQFFNRLACVRPPPRPTWLKSVSELIALESRPSTEAIAASLDLHPAWLARSYRAATGEGLHETLRRKRVERALLALRGSEMPLAEVALEAGFCDQPHMNRCFRHVLGRSPHEYRLAALAA